MQIKKEFIIREIAGKNVVISTGKKALDFDYIIHLNDSGKLLFETLLEKDCTVDDLVAVLMAEYDVDEKQALQDVNDFVKMLKEKDIL